MNEALDAIRASGLALRPYRCDRCFHYHLTSRTRGKPRIVAIIDARGRG